MASSSPSTTLSPSTASAQDKAVYAPTTTASVTSTTATTSTPSRRYRYSRSSTASVTQLLSDSCNSLLQRFRRNPSERPEKKSNVPANTQR